MNAVSGSSPRNTYVGTPVERIEDLRLLRGRGQYVDDVQPDGLLHAAFLRSSIPHGRVVSIDAEAARELPGVHAVLTAKDIAGALPHIPIRLMPVPQLEPFRHPVIAVAKVRYVGEILAVVVADSQGIAEDAVDLIEADIDPLPPISDCVSAGAGAALLFEEVGSNSAITYSATKGDAAEAFADADYVRRERFAVQRHIALPMEPRGLVAEWDAERQHLTVWGAAKVPFYNRRALAAMMGLDESDIELIENDVGGGFGARGEFFAEDFLVPFAARHLRRPVKWIEDRRDHLLTTGHAREMDCEIELACRADGTILGLRGQISVDIGAYFRTSGAISPRNVAHFMSGPYRIPNIDLQSTAFLTNKAPTGTYRGPGRFETDFFRERLFDLAAGDLGIDRATFRRRNLVTKDEMPYPIATVREPERAEKLDSGDYPRVFDLCLKEFGWEEKSQLAGQLIDGRYHGVAVVCFIEGGAAGPKEHARMVLEADGTVSVYVGSTSVGQGIETVLTQIAADALELPIERVRLRHGSTHYTSDGGGSYHSRSTVMGGTAILLAAEKLKGKIRAAAAQRLGCLPDAIELVEGNATGPGGTSAPWPELAGDEMCVEEVFSNHTHTYAYGTAAAHVTVDAGTGQVELIDLLLTEDVGRVVNPLTLKGQAVGAIVQGLGGALMEHLIYDENAQVVTGSLADYLVPLATDFPRIRAIMLGLEPSPVSPLGAKGAGEGGTIPIGGLIANAVASALSSIGVEPRALPLSPPSVWALITGARNKERLAH